MPEELCTTPCSAVYESENKMVARLEGKADRTEIRWLIGGIFVLLTLLLKPTQHNMFKEVVEIRAEIQAKQTSVEDLQREIGRLRTQLNQPAHMGDDHGYKHGDIYLP